MSTPSPTIMSKFKKPAPVEFVAPAPAERIVAEFEPQAGSKVRPGFKTQIVEVDHDGVIKAKQLPGLLRKNPDGVRVRAFLHNEPRGGEHKILTAVPNEDGGVITVTFEGRPAAEYAAAYRFHVQALVGTPVQIRRQVPALVEYTEV